MKVEPDVRAAALLKPVSTVISQGASRLPDAEPLAITVGRVEGFAERRGHRLVLSDALEGPGVHHPDEAGPLPPMDRWRRAAITVLVEAATSGIAAAVGTAPQRDWRWVGLATDMCHVVAPVLRADHEGLIEAIETGAPGTYPRAGIAVMAAWRARGQDPWARTIELLRGGVISPEEWLALGQWVLHPDCAGAELPIAVRRVGEIDIPCAIDAWRWQPLAVPPHRRGGLVEVEGPGAVSEPWAVANAELRTLAASTEDDVQLLPRSGGPVGNWIVTSAEGFGQVMGARGVTFEFESSGTLQLVFADAFVGPLAAVAMAEEVGTSGVAIGRWSVAGPHRLGFSKLDDSQLTLHGRKQSSFMMPAGGFGIAAWLSALEDNPWAWTVSGDRLVLRGQMLGGWVDVRLRRA